jgi:hypothetical protein
MNANGEGSQHGVPRPTTPADFEMGGPEPGDREVNEALVQPSPSPPGLTGDDPSSDTDPFYSQDTPPFR